MFQYIEILNKGLLKSNGKSVTLILLKTECG